MQKKKKINKSKILVAYITRYMLKKIVKNSQLNIETKNKQTNKHIHTHIQTCEMHNTLKIKHTHNQIYATNLTEQYKLGKWLFMRMKFNVFIFTTKTECYLK